MAITLSATALFDLPLLKLWLRIDAATASEDDILALIGNAVSARVEKDTGRVLVARRLTEQHRGHGTNVLRLRHYPVAAVESVTVDGVVLADTDYTLDTETGAIYLAHGRVFPRGGSVYDPFVSQRPAPNVEVVYTAGADDVPSDLQQSALEAVKFSYDAWKTGAASMNTVSMPNGGTLTLQANLPKSITDVWRLHRKARV